MPSTRLHAIAQSPSLTAAWRNYDGTATVYLDDDVPGPPNDITLTLTDGLGFPLVLPAGSPAPYGQLPAGQSCVYLFFNALVGNTAVAGCDISAAGWTVARFTDPDTGLLYLAAAPLATVTVPAGGTLAFALTKLVDTGSPTAGNLTLAVSGVAALTQAQSQIPVYVQVCDRPQPKQQRLDVLVGFTGGDTVLTGADRSNSLTLFLTNPGSTPLAPGGSDSWGPRPPTLTLTLVYGSGPGALTTAENAAQISVDLGAAYDNVWKPVQRHTQGVSPYWTMQPDPHGGGTILGSGSHATVTFDLSGIVTVLPQGLTVVHLAYSGFPGYADGSFALDLLKVDPVSVPVFGATPASITNATGAVPVVLDFTVHNAAHVVVTNTPYAHDPQGADLTDQVTVEVDSTTAFTLIATDFDTGQQVARSVVVPVTDPSPTVHALTVETGATVTGTLTTGAATVKGRLNGGQAQVTQLASITPDYGSGRGGPGSDALLDDTEHPSAVVGANNSPDKPSGLFVNVSGSQAGSMGSGIASVVSGPSQYGVWTNGLIHSIAGHAPLTQLPGGPDGRMATSPLTLHPELHLSGTARLRDGRTVVVLPEHTADLLHHDEQTPYRVQLTPTAHCRGLALTEKRPDGFTVEELNNGRSDASFDWFLVGHLRAPGDTHPSPARLPGPPGTAATDAV